MKGEHRLGQSNVDRLRRHSLLVLHCLHTSALDPQECFRTTLGRPP